MSVRFFLGANSALGFNSLYGDFARDKGDRLQLIKGGPGCGKSSFMKKLASEAEKRGFAVQYILCSGDPESLDGVYFPELMLGYADATAPHALEPGYFGYDSCYVNLGQFCSDCSDERIPALTEKYRKMYDCAYSYLAAAGSVKKAQIPDILSKTTLSSVKSCARSAANAVEFKDKFAQKKITQRYISAISCEGELVLGETVSELCKQIYLVDDRFGLEEIYFNELLSMLCGNLIVCPSPLLPDRIEAILLPDEGIAFVAASLLPTAKAKRRIRLSALVPKELAALRRDEVRVREELYKALCAQAVFYLEKAKRCHDELEAVYRDSVDFDALDAFTADEIRLVFD